jgi:hypothetical protein
MQWDNTGQTPVVPSDEQTRRGDNWGLTRVVPLEEVISDECTT